MFNTPDSMKTSLIYDSFDNRAKNLDEI